MGGLRCHPLQHWLFVAAASVTRAEEVYTVTADGQAVENVTVSEDVQRGIDANFTNQTIDIYKLQDALCNVCADTWLDSLWVNHKPVLRKPEADCFALILIACSDCKKDGWPGEGFPKAKCSHNYYTTEPQPISGHFGFCSGHAAATWDTMSYVAWMRLISWRDETCMDPKPSAYLELTEELAEREDAFWLNFYEAGHSGWAELPSYKPWIEIEIEEAKKKERRMKLLQAKAEQAVLDAQRQAGFPIVESASGEATSEASSGAG